MPGSVTTPAGAAGTADFIALASRVSGRRLGPFLHAWLYEKVTPPMPGHPEWRKTRSARPRPGPAPPSPLGPRPILRPVASDALRIAQVTPYPWEQHHEVNHFVDRLSDELCRRGHQVVVVAPSDSRELVREGRARVEAQQRDSDALFAEAGSASLVAVGQSLPFRRGGSVALPLDVSRTLEDLLEHTELDFVHVHEPFAPSAASAALRHSRALNVGSFHGATERLLSTQVARRVVELLFGRLDGRSASFTVTRELMERYFPGDYRLIRPGADLLHRTAADAEGPPEIVFSAEEERGALRLFLRALRRLSTDLDWRATIWLRDPSTAPAVTLPRRLRDRVRLAGPGRRLGGAAPGPRADLRGRVLGRGARALSSCCVPWPAARCPWSRACRSTRSPCATASWDCSSSRATP